MDTGLIAYDPHKREILFISGHTFLDDISIFFFRREITRNEIINYLKLRYYNYSIAGEIAVDPGNVASFYSQNLKRKIKVAFSLTHKGNNRIFQEKVL